MNIVSMEFIPTASPNKRFDRARIILDQKVVFHDACMSVNTSDTVISSEVDTIMFCNWEYICI